MVRSWHHSGPIAHEECFSSFIMIIPFSLTTGIPQFTHSSKTYGSLVILKYNWKKKIFTRKSYYILQKNSQFQASTFILILLRGHSIHRIVRYFFPTLFVIDDSEVNRVSHVAADPLKLSFLRGTFDLAK